MSNAGANGGGAGLGPSGFFAFRAPAFPFCTLTEWSDAPAHELRTRLAEIAGRPEFEGALSVASPDLLDALRERPDDPGVQAAVARYVTRMASRPTPYGLFAACGVGEIGDRTHIELPPLAAWNRHTRLDADYLDALIRELLPKLRPKLTLRPNDSLHLMGGRWRYVESRLDGLDRSHHLVEVGDSGHLRRALEAAREGATVAEVAAAVVAGGADEERAVRYVDQLVEAQVLLPDLAVNITGALPLDALIADLEALEERGTVAVLRAVRDELAAIDAEGFAAAPSRHEAIASHLAELPAPVERARLLQVDATIPHCGATLASSTVDDLARGVELLRRIAPVRPNEDLKEFRDRFRERYEGREVPLLEALDEELGVGFGAAAQRGDPSPLMKGIVVPASASRELPIGAPERKLLELMHRAWSERTLEVSLSREDLEQLERPHQPPLPAALSATAVLARTEHGPRVILQVAAGPSGAVLLGRFCHADARLADHVRRHLREEEALDPDAIHAEIVHLPGGRMVNILARPLLRDHELEWLGRSGAPRERRLSASDLLLSLRDDRFALRSSTLGRRVLPRLTSAHNYNRRSPGVYRFLAALQAEGTTDALTWSWQPFDRAPFTPRVRCGRLILARARWWVPAAELRELGRTDLQAWRERRRLPRWVCLIEHDNVLPVDLENPISVDMFVRLVRRRDEIQLEELFPGPDELIAEGPDGRRAMEVVVPLVRQAPVNVTPGDHADAAAPLPEKALAGDVRRTFGPGSEWTYLKLYTGSATADRLLRDPVARLAQELVGSGAADGWFFLRYSDSGFHLRVRFHGDPSDVRPPLEALAARALEEGLAHEAMLGTYQREVERYGGPDAILLAERFFHIDSDAVVQLLSMFESGEDGLDERWRVGLVGADALMRDLGLDEQARARQARRTRESFERELRADARLHRSVAEKLRQERAALDELLDATPDGEHPLSPGLRVLAERSARLAPVAAELAALSKAGRLGLPIESLSVSYVHMWLNRLCRSENRLQEYVTYALLDRLHEARAARQVSSRKPTMPR